MPRAHCLDAIALAQGFRIAPHSARMAMRTGSTSRDHADPFERMIAATALETAVPLASEDEAFDGLTDTAW